VSKNIGIWIDHKKAVVVIIKEEGEEIRLIQSDVEKRVRFRGGTRMKTTYGAQYFPAEDHKDRQFIEQLKKFYGIVISILGDGDSILVFGPGEAKSELEKRIAHERVGAKIVGIETVDKMTQSQIVAKVRRFFKKK
jgi:hypothetical protein